MSKRKPQVRVTTKETMFVPPVIQAAHRLVAAIEAFAVAAERDTEVCDLVALPHLLGELYGVGTSGEAAAQVRDLEAAWRVINSGASVSDSLPRRPPERASGLPATEFYRWRGPLTPEQILRAAAGAGPEDPDYRTQLQNNAEFHSARVYDGGAKCGRLNKAGRPCAAIPVWVPGRGFVSGAPCYRHMTDEEIESACEVYDEAVASHECPGCGATAGADCGTDHAVPVEGSWPRIRSFRGRSVHDVRLNLVLRQTQ